MPIVTLSAAFVRTAICPEGKIKENYFDTNIRGFVLETRCTGSATYCLRYNDEHGRQRQHKIGDSKSISFDKAKNAAQQLRSRVVLGENPAEDRMVKRAIPTLADFCADRYMPFIKGYKRSWGSDDCYLRHHILPRFGSRHLDEINQQAVVEFHHSMKANGYAMGTANRMLVLLRYMYNLAKKWQIPGSDNNPTSGVPMYEANNGRERFLDPLETLRLRDALEHSDNKQLKYIVALLLLTGARKRELLDSCWEHFDLDKRTWRIPTCKTGKARHVPLSSSVISILEQLPRWKGCAFVVPNPKTRLPYTGIFASWNTARKAAGLPDVRMHDLRHSMASNMVNSGRSIYEVAKVLGHTQLKTTARYSHLSQTTLLEAVDSAATATGICWGPPKTVPAIA